MKEQDYLDIEAYQQGELPSDQVKALVARVTTEPDLAAVMSERQLLNDHLRATAKEPALRETLSVLGAKYFADGTAPNGQNTTATNNEAVVKTLKPQKKNWLVIAASAAAILLLFVVGGKVFFGEQDSTYEQFAQHQPLSLTERGDGDNGITQAEAAFNNGRYEEAILPLTEYVELNKEDARARLALGISYLETGNDAEAIRVLTEVAETGGSVAPYGNWYLALAAVRNDDKPAALRYLDRIPPGDTFLEERVTELRQVVAE
ncbi:hypothetical protein FUA23_01950 [Neolewinella aurantiaca]|uniref:Tetratricopeptide repeat protein n=1 Tax=Neolewinella aurantiaca TaxID=2602767 RepID=A0A5C7FMW0_9BACT|nr:tetratricopeptide repeat protein [Neolewinella aurantiaca]TXF91482.1 hypothetical protein FUA23_01950 [Neolewinella aurantiaca]